MTRGRPPELPALPRRGLVIKKKDRKTNEKVREIKEKRRWGENRGKRGR